MKTDGFFCTPKKVYRKFTGSGGKNIDFLRDLGYDKSGKQKRPGAPDLKAAGGKDETYMKSLDKLLMIIGIITTVLAMAATIAAVLTVLNRQKEDAELEEYLEGAIQ